MVFEGFSTENKKLVQTVTTTTNTLQKDVLESHKERLISRGGHFTPEQLIPVYFAALLGVPDGEDDKAGYRNMLWSLRQELIKSPKMLFYSENELKGPTEEELAQLGDITADNDDPAVLVESLQNAINIDCDPVRTRLARAALPMFLEGLDGQEALRAGRTLIVWLNRRLMSDAYQSDHSEIPVILHYGRIGAAETAFFHFMSRVGVDVVYIRGDSSGLPELKRNNLEGRMQIFELPRSAPDEPYPSGPVKAKLATVAYTASKELNNMLYGGDTFFRDFQFSDMQSQTLKTTYDEIDILWHQSAKYRIGFAVNEDKVTVPNIFAKISGVKDGDMDAYWKRMEWRLSPYTRVIIKSPAYKKYQESQLEVYRPYYNGKRIHIDDLKKSPLNKYGYLSDSLQTLIFNKMQEAVDSGFLLLEPDELLPMVIYVGLNLDREALRLLQKFDFTKDIPKLIVIDVIEDTFSKVECIQLVIYNLLGFDILVCTPTGYRDIETYVSEAAFETHTMNEFKYNVRVPRFKLPNSIPDPNSGKYRKLFRKGK